MAALDHAVSSAITKLHALERSLHDSGPWRVRYGPDTVPAERAILDDGVTFTAEFPRSHGSLPAILLCDDEIVFVFPMESPEWNGAFLARMVLQLGNPVSV